jgi:hypothetical protein
MFYEIKINNTKPILNSKDPKLMSGIVPMAYNNTSLPNIYLFHFKKQGLAISN